MKIIILVHFNRKLTGLTSSVWNTQHPDKTDPNYARLTVFGPTVMLGNFYVSKQ